MGVELHDFMHWLPSLDRKQFRGQLMAGSPQPDLQVFLYSVVTFIDQVKISSNLLCALIVGVRGNKWGGIGFMSSFSHTLSVAALHCVPRLPLRCIVVPDEAHPNRRSVDWQLKLDAKLFPHHVTVSAIQQSEPQQSHEPL